MFQTKTRHNYSSWAIIIQEGREVWNVLPA